MEASGAADNSILISQYTNLGIKHYEAKQTDLAAAALEKAVALDGNNANSLKLLGSVRDMQGRKAEAITLLQKSLAVSRAAGRPPKENDYKFAAKLAYEAKAPAAADITRAWLADYPNLFADMSAGSGLNSMTRDEEHAREFLKRHQDKLLFGSDCNDKVGEGTRCQGAQILTAIRKLAPSKEIERKILHGNAKKLLRLPACA